MSSAKISIGFINAVIGQNFEVNIGYKPDFVMLLFDDLTFNIMYSRDFSSTTYRICYTSQPTYDVNLGNFPVYNYVRFDITELVFIIGVITTVH